MSRRGSVTRKTRETSIAVVLDLDGGDVDVVSGIPFFDHMLDQLGRHSRIALRVDARGDLDVDAHHTVEDTGICIGEALVQALGDKSGTARYGDALVPMEESLAQVALDLSGRPLLVYDAPMPAEVIGAYEVALTEEFLQALCRSGGINMHVRLLAGRNAHHATEAIFKCVARALGAAVAVDPRGGGIPSTKGMLA
ncbi:MAG: imidazoleglycerol-phosphate dehydratase HisB [Actinomycetota bacterium]|nr:imidazoleglycerol-phosphate dehydratase HisB [Actinomycetota bacterium]